MKADKTFSTGPWSCFYLLGIVLEKMQILFYKTLIEITVLLYGKVAFGSLLVLDGGIL